MLHQEFGYGHSLQVVTGPTGNDWLTEFRGNLHAILHALSSWKELAVETMYAATDANNGFGVPFRVARELDTLTDIVALWCDAELHLDPLPLTEARRRFMLISGQERRCAPIPMTDAQIAEMMIKAMDFFDRAYIATEARFAQTPSAGQLDTKTGKRTPKKPHNKGKLAPVTKLIRKLIDCGKTNTEIETEIPSATSGQVRTARYKYRCLMPSKGKAHSKTSRASRAK